MEMSTFGKISDRCILIIRNDSLLYERYFRDYDKGTPVASFSMAKSYCSALIGIAIAEGKIKSEDDLVVNYITELKGKRLGQSHHSSFTSNVLGGENSEKATILPLVVRLLFLLWKNFA